MAAKRLPKRGKPSAPKRAKRPAQPALPPIVENAPRRLKRSEVALMLGGVSTTTVRALEESHRLTVVETDERGTRYYDEREVRTLAFASDLPRPRRSQRDAGEIAALAFRMFAKGTDWREVVTELEVEPALARALLLEWRGPNDLLLTAADGAAFRSLGCEGPGGVLSGASILAKLRRVIAGLHELNLATTRELLNSTGGAERRRDVDAPDVGHSTRE